MPRGYLMQSVVAAAGLAALPILSLLAYYVLTDTTGKAVGVVGNGAIVPAILCLLLVLYAVIGVIQNAASEIPARGTGTRWKPAAAAVAMVATFLSTIVWLMWAQGEGWPLASLDLYIALVTGVAGLSLLLMPGALLQAFILGRKRTPALMRHDSS